MYNTTDSPVRTGRVPVFRLIPSKKALRDHPQQTGIWQRVPKYPDPRWPRRSHLKGRAGHRCRLAWFAHGTRTVGHGADQQFGASHLCLVHGSQE